MNELVVGPGPGGDQVVGCGVLDPGGNNRALGAWTAAYECLRAPTVLMSNMGYICA